MNSPSKNATVSPHTPMKQRCQAILRNEISRQLTCDLHCHLYRTAKSNDSPRIANGFMRILSPSCHGILLRCTASKPLSSTLGLELSHSINSARVTSANAAAWQASISEQARQCSLFTGGGGTPCAIICLTSLTGASTAPRSSGVITTSRRLRLDA